MIGAWPIACSWSWRTRSGRWLGYLFLAASEPGDTSHDFSRDINISSTAGWFLRRSRNALRYVALQLVDKALMAHASHVCGC